MIPDHINPMQWHQSIGVARQSCARFFSDGGNPADAMRAFGLKPEQENSADWSRAVEAIASALGMSPVRHAA
jgi:hypothetical protein